MTFVTSASTVSWKLKSKIKVLLKAQCVVLLISSVKLQFFILCIEIQFLIVRQ